MCCNKFVLVLTNIITSVIGIIVIVLSSIFISKGEDYGELLFEGILTIPVLILILGIFIAVVGLLGCLGALRESKCMLYSYACIVLFLLLGTFALGIVMLTARSTAEEKLEKSMNNTFSKYGGDDENLTNLIDFTQEELKCCGVNSYKDWADWYNKTNVPKSCCVEQTKGCNIINSNKQNIYENGCIDKVVEEFRKIALLLGISSIILCAVMMFNFIAACTIARSNNY